MRPTSKNFLSSEFALAKTFVLLGILLRSIQFFFNEGLREDEGHLAANFITRDLNGVLQPLDHAQVAPPLFLIIEKLSVMAFGQHEFSVRYFPFLCGCLVLLFAYKFLKEHTNPEVTTLTIALLAINRWLIFSSVAAKQYSGDVAICVLLFYLLFTTQNFVRANRILLLGIVGAIAIWFSFIAIFVLFAVGLVLLISLKQSTTVEKGKTLLVYLAWLLSIGAFYFTIVAGHPNRTIMNDYWGSHFMPLLPSTLKELAWYPNHFRDMISYLLGFSNRHAVLWIPYSFCFLLGTYYCYKNRPYRMFLWFFPVVFVHLIFSGLDVYPFHGRLILYLSLPVCLLIGIGIYQAIQYVQKFIPSIKLFKPSLLLLTLPLLLIALINFPYEMEDIKKPLGFVRTHFKDGDTIYVYYASDGSFDFYKKKYFKSDVPVVYGKESRDNFAGYDNEIDKLSGRTWFIFSHISTNEKGLAEDQYIIDAAESKGGRLLKEMHWLMASAYLVEFNKSNDAYRRP